MKINNIEDVINNYEELNSGVITDYEGRYIFYKDDEGSPCSEVELSNGLFRALQRLGYLVRTGYVVSHRAVVQYKLKSNLSRELPNILRELIGLSVNKSFRSKKALIEYYESNGFRVSEISQFYSGSYWGGSRYTNTLSFKKDGASVNVTNYCRENCLNKNKMFTQFLIDYCRLVGISPFLLSDIHWVNGRKSTKPFSDFYYKQFPNKWNSSLKLEDIKEVMNEQKELYKKLKR